MTFTAFAFWLVVLIVAIFIEIHTVALVSVWFAFGSFLSIIALSLGVDWIQQIWIFLASSLGFILICRPLVKRYVKVNSVPTNADRMIGQQVKVLSPISSGEVGTVKVYGSIWNAINYNNEEIEAGTLVEILSIDGSKVIVKKI